MASFSSRVKRRLKDYSSRILSSHPVQVVRPAYVSPVVKRQLIRSAIVSVRSEPSIEDRHIRHRVSFHDLHAELKRVRDDTPEGRAIRSKRSGNVINAHNWFEISRSARRTAIRAEYISRAIIHAGEQAIESLPLSFVARTKLHRELTGALRDIAIPRKYYGDIVRINREERNEDVAAFRRRALQLIRPILSGMMARLFLSRFYSYFRAYTSSGRKNVSRKKTKSAPVP